MFLFHYNMIHLAQKVMCSNPDQVCHSEWVWASHMYVHVHPIASIFNTKEVKMLLGWMVKVNCRAMVYVVIKCLHSFWEDERDDKWRIRNGLGAIYGWQSMPARMLT